MKKLLVYGGLTVLVLGLALYFTLQYFLGTIVKAGVNKFGPSITQTKVELQHAEVSPLSGVGTLTGFSVGNPPGWGANNAFHLGKVHVDLEPFSVFGDHIVINEVLIEEPVFVYETKIVSSNIGDLLKNIERSLGSGQAAEPTKDGKPVKMVIKKFTLRNGRVTVGAAGAALTMPMPPVELTNIGGAEGGVTPAGVALAVMRSVTTSVVAAATQALTKGGSTTTGNATIEAAKQAVDAFKGILGGDKKKSPPPTPAP